MVDDTIKWFPQVMGHPGEVRLRETLNQHYHHPKLCYHIDRLKCKDSKNTNYQLWLWPPTQKRSADCTLGRSRHQFDWTMEGQSQWSTSWVQCIDLHWYSFKFSWTHSCWSQDSQTYSWQVLSKLAMLMSSSCTLFTWQGRWIHWTKLPMVIGNV